MNRRFIRRAGLTAAVLMLCILLSGCAFVTGTMSSLPDGMEKDTVCELAISIVDAVNRGSYERAVSLAPSSALSASDLEKACGELAAKGAFSEYAMVQTYGVNRESGRVAVVTLNCVHEKARATYNVTFDSAYGLLEFTVT